MVQIQANPAIASLSAKSQAAQADTAGVDNAKKSGSIDTDPLAQKEVFLQLLVAQIKNQNPLNPTDSVQFLTQLSQFTATEQLVGIRKDIGAMLQNETNKPTASKDPAPTNAGG